MKICRGKKLNTIAIIQARLGSTRLPRKVLLDLCGKSVIQRVYERASLIKGVKKVVIATTLNEEDSELAQHCLENGMNFYRGSSDDVLDRFYRTAQYYGADSVIRITGDCPLIDPKEIDKVVNKFKSSGADYTSNTQPRRLPDGLDSSIVSFESLEVSWKEAVLKSDREHVTNILEIIKKNLV